MLAALFPPNFVHEVITSRLLCRGESRLSFYSPSASLMQTCVTTDSVNCLPPWSEPTLSSRCEAGCRLGALALWTGPSQVVCATFTCYHNAKDRCRPSSTLQIIGCLSLTRARERSTNEERCLHMASPRYSGQAKLVWSQLMQASPITAKPPKQVGGYERTPLT